MARIPHDADQVAPLRMSDRMTVRITLSAEDSRALNRVARQQRVTLRNVIQQAVRVYIERQRRRERERRAV